MRSTKIRSALTGTALVAALVFTSPAGAGDLTQAAPGNSVTAIAAAAIDDAPEAAPADLSAARDEATAPDFVAQEQQADAAKDAAKDAACCPCAGTADVAARRADQAA
jgi:uncharacterized protein (DUF1800 family)